MPRYITLIRFTEQGAKSLAKSTSRARAFVQSASKAGVRVVGQYWTLGSCDGVIILEADNENTILHTLSALAAEGYVRTETLRAFNEAEFDAIVK